MNAPDPNVNHYTYADYLKWTGDERWELIEGRAYAMYAMPTEQLANHQLVLTALTAISWQYFENTPVQVIAGPVNVRLPEKNDKDELVDTIVRPDLLILSDRSKLDGECVRGAPDLVIEILSESTLERDLDIKLHLYEKHGVRCYIIADPYGKTLTVRYLEAEGKYGRPELFAGDDQMPVKIFEGLVLDLPRIFANL